MKWNGSSGNVQSKRFDVQYKWPNCDYSEELTLPTHKHAMPMLFMHINVNLFSCMHGSRLICMLKFFNEIHDEIFKQV